MGSNFLTIWKNIHHTFMDIRSLAGTYSKQMPFYYRPAAGNRREFGRRIPDL
jgi:hypothetical protein